MKNPKIAIAALSLSAAGFAALITHEGYVGQAMIPTKGDRPTVGFGSTFREDGSPVQLGDTITPERAVNRSLGHIVKDESGIKACITAPISQVEYDLLVDFAYQYGVPTLCKSSIARSVNAGDYAQACSSYLKYKFAAGYDCSTPGNRRCPGVWKRSQARYKQCMDAQGG